jgi:hypothetical protein
VTPISQLREKLRRGDFRDRPGLLVNCLDIAIEALEEIMIEGTTGQGNTPEATRSYEALEQVASKLKDL